MPVSVAIRVLGLALGLPTVGAFGAVGAVSVGFGSFQARIAAARGHALCTQR
jgi:hypothetical protein